MDEIIKLYNEYGIGILLAYFLFEILKNLLYSIIPENFKFKAAKYLEILKIKLQNPYRDEEIRKSVIIDLLKESNTFRISIYKEIYSLFFDVLYGTSDIEKKSLSLSKEEILAEYNKLFDKAIEARKKIFINMIYAPEFMTLLLQAVIGINGDIQRSFQKIYHKNSNFISDIPDSSEAIDKAGKWLIDNLLINTTPKLLYDKVEDSAKFDNGQKVLETKKIIF